SKAAKRLSRRASKTRSRRWRRSKRRISLPQAGQLRSRKFEDFTSEMIFPIATTFLASRLPILMTWAVAGECDVVYSGRTRRDARSADDLFGLTCAIRFHHRYAQRRYAHRLRQRLARLGRQQRPIAAASVEVDRACQINDARR